MSITSLLYGREVCALKQRDIRRLYTKETDFIIRIAGNNSFDLIRTEDILDEIKVDPVDKKLTQYKRNLLNLVRGMEDINYPKRLLDYRPIGRRLHDR
jgi:hypothetical protein